MCSILRRCWFNSMIIWGDLMMYSGVPWFSKSTVWFYLRFYGHDLITFSSATFLSALTALPSFDERIWICKDQQIIGFIPWQLSFTFSNSYFKRQVYFRTAAHLHRGGFLQVKGKQIQIIFTKNKDSTVQQKLQTFRCFVLLYTYRFFHYIV